MWANYTENEQAVIKMILLDNPFIPNADTVPNESVIYPVQRQSSENSSSNFLLFTGKRDF